MEIGAHLPLIPLSDGVPSLAGLRAYAAAASRLGYRWLSANDHLVFRRPWLDGLTALAAVLDVSGDLELATTVCLPAVRGPAQAAKAFAALDLLSGGRFTAGLGPGSSERDYVAGGVPTEDRFARFEEAVRAVRALLGRDPEPFSGRFYSTVGVTLEPPPARPGGPPIWLAGWGGARGLRRAAELGDGWLASGYNTTPGGFAASWARVREHVAARGADPDRFSNGIATLWAYVTEDRAAAERVLADVLAPLLGRPVESLRQLALPIGPAEVCAERLSAFADAGAQRVLFWPLADGVRQLELLAERVMPHVRRPYPARVGSAARAGTGWGAAREGVDVEQDKARQGDDPHYGEPAKDDPLVGEGGDERPDASEEEKAKAIDRADEQAREASEDATEKTGREWSGGMASAD